MNSRKERAVEKKLFSVVIPAYGSSDVWKVAVDSVLMQDYPAIELIFTDDCSPDFDIDIVRKYIEDNKCANLVNYAVVQNEENMGTVRNLRNAHACCTGYYLTHIAMDDSYCDQTVLSQYAAALDSKTEDAVGIYGKSVVCNEDMKSLGYTSFNTVRAKEMNKMTAMEQFGELARRCCIHMGATAFVRDEFLRCGDFDTDYRLLEDWPFFLKATISGKKLFFVDFDAIFYRNGGVTDAKFSSRSKRMCCIDHIRQYERLILPNLHFLPYEKQARAFYKYALDRMDMAFIYGRMSEMGTMERIRKYWRFLPMEALAMTRRKWRYVLIWLLCMAALLFCSADAGTYALSTIAVLFAGIAAEHMRCRWVRKKLEEGKI